MSWNREEVSMLLEEYRKWPNLYKVKSVNYKNRNLRNRALESICAQLRFLKPDISTQDIQGKFQALKQNASKERKKLLESHKSGAGTDEIAEPSLWYYKLISYVFDDQVPREAIDSLDEEVQKVFVLAESPVEFETQFSSTSRRLSTPGTSSRVTTPNPPISPGAKKRKREEDDVAEVKIILRSNSKSLTTQEALPAKTKSQIFAEYLASKMERIYDEDLRDETEAELIAVVHSAIKKCRNK